MDVRKIDKKKQIGPVNLYCCHCGAFLTKGCFYEEGKPPYHAACGIHVRSVSIDTQRVSHLCTECALDPMHKFNMLTGEKLNE